MILTILSILLLCGPLVFELVDDRRGDTDKTMDVALRIAIGLLTSFVAWFTDGRNFLAAFNLSMAIHFAFFDYIIAYILIKNGKIEPPRGVKYHWFTYVAKKGLVDNIQFWRKMNPYVKLGIRVAYFLISVILYFVI